MKDFLVQAVSDVEVSHRCVEMIVMDLCPLTIIERKGFQMLTSFLNPGFRFPSRKTLRKRIMAAHIIAKSVTREEIRRVKCSIHGTTDAWSSSSMKGFMSLTLKYVDEKFVMKTLPADVSRIKGRHTGENISSEMNFLIENSGARRLCTITTDSAANQVKAAKLSIKSGHVQVRLPCAAHVINLAARKLCHGKVRKELADDSCEKEPILELGGEIDDDDEEEQEARLNDAEDDEEDELVEAGAHEAEFDDEDVNVGQNCELANTVIKLRRLVTLIRKSQILGEAIAESQQRARMEYKWVRNDLKVIIDVKTRWSSTHAMVGRALLLREHIEAAKQKATKSQRRRFLNDDEWELLDELQAALEPFSAATKVLSGESYVTSTRVMETWKRLTKTLKLLKEKNEFKVSDTAIDILVSALDGYWEKHMQSKVLLCSAAFDPNHKKLKLITCKQLRETVWRRIAEEACEVAKQINAAVKKNVSDLPDKNDSGNELALLSESESEEENEAEKSSSSNNEDSREGLPRRAKKTESSMDFRVASEIAKYRGMRIKERENPLLWWRKHKELFPLLSIVARSYLGASASSVASERLFSLCGHISGGRRVRLGSALISAIIHLNSCSKIPDLWEKIKMELRNVE